MDLRPLLKQAWDADAELIANVKPGQFAGETRCTDWDCRALLNHLIGDNHAVAHLAGGGKVDPSAPEPDFLAGDDAVSAFEQSVKAADGALGESGVLERPWHFPWGDLTGEQAVGVFLNEAVVHGLDLADATGQRAPVLEQLAATIYPGVKGSIPDEYRGPGRPFANEIEVPEDAPGHEKLLAYLGRKA